MNRQQLLQTLRGYRMGQFWRSLFRLPMLNLFISAKYRILLSAQAAATNRQVNLKSMPCIATNLSAPCREKWLMAQA